MQDNVVWVSIRTSYGLGFFKKAMKEMLLKIPPSKDLFTSALHCNWSNTGIFGGPRTEIISLPGIC